MVSHSRSTFEQLFAEAEAALLEGWGFSWRAKEDRPWGYARLVAERMQRASAALDIQTGGGEILASIPRLAALTIATEARPQSLSYATKLLRPRGVAVIADENEPPLPFANDTFDLVVSRHPTTTWWEEIARVLQPGGTFLSQQVESKSVLELLDTALGGCDVEFRGMETLDLEAAVESAGLDIVELRRESVRTEFHDIGGVIYFLRKTLALFRGFTLDRCRAELEALHERIETGGTFAAQTTRILIETRKPL